MGERVCSFIIIVAIIFTVTPYHRPMCMCVRLCVYVYVCASVCVSSLISLFQLASTLPWDGVVCITVVIVGQCAGCVLSWSPSPLPPSVHSGAQCIGSTCCRCHCRNRNHNHQPHHIRECCMCVYRDYLHHQPPPSNPLSRPP